ncbi:MAG: hypothetical protein II732_05755 [Lachnospiraceae bacterium]|nr:hypothetical protein [Lachnospiraceae bacterium]
MEIKNEQAAVLDDTGVVHAVINRGYTAGQVLNLTETELKRDEVRPLYRADGRRMHRYTGIVAAALALIIIGGSVSAYAAPVSTVKISDGEDAVEYKLNIFDRVVRVESADKELPGQVRGMKITDAMDVTAERMDRSRAAKEDETAAEIHDISVDVSGLRRKNPSFNERLDNKVMEIHERRQAERPGMPESTDKPENADSPGQYSGGTPEQTAPAQGTQNPDVSDGTTHPETPEGQERTEPEDQERAKPEGQERTTPEGRDRTMPEGQEITVPEGQERAKPEGQERTMPEDRDRTTPEGPERTMPEEQDRTMPEGQERTTPEGQDRSMPEKSGGYGAPGMDLRGGGHE